MRLFKVILEHTKNSNHDNKTGRLILISELNLMNAGKTCWYSCGGKQGKCSWCGSDGWCCRKNGNSPYWLPTQQSNGCDGTFGGSTQHQCVLKPCSGLAAGKERIILKQVLI